MRRFATFVLRRRWWIIGIVAVLIPIAAIVGGDVARKLSVGGYQDPAAESFRASRVLADRYGATRADFVLVVTAGRGTVDSPAVARAGAAITAQLAAEPQVRSAASYWTLHKAPPLRSTDGTQALVIASLRGDDSDAVAAAEALRDRYTRNGPVISTAITGSAEVARQATEIAADDLERSDLFTLPITLLALIVVFGSILAASLPLAVGMVAVLGTFVVLTVLSGTTEVSVFALNLTTALGLGLAIDYSLFVVSRFREELRSGVTKEVALSRTMQTAGRTVLFSGATVAVSLLSLLVFPIPYLRSFAYAGIAVVVLAATGAVVLLPAVLAVVGHRLEWGTVIHRKPHEPGTGFWHDQAVRVMRHPVIYAVAVSAVLVFLALPFLDLRPGQIDDRVLPEGRSSRDATDAVRENFTSREAGGLQILLARAGAPGPARDAAVARYATALAAIDGVERVDAATGYYVADAAIPADDLTRQRFGSGPAAGTWVSVIPAVEPISPEGERLVAAVRAVPAPGGAAVSGLSAQLVDSKQAVADKLPYALGIVAIATFFLLFMMTGSLLVPLKALILNVLSLTATFGGMVWVFQKGHGAGLLGFTPTGTIDTFTPVLMFCIAFGLSMDYEVFLLSRIKEVYDLDRDNERAVAEGLEHTGGIVTAAAVLLSIVFLGVATSAVSVVKLFGLGLTVAVIVDAFLIRATLVPAFMRLAGRANWWAPKPLRRFHLRYGIWENEPIAILDPIQAAAAIDDTGAT